MKSIQLSLKNSGDYRFFKCGNTVMLRLFWSLNELHASSGLFLKLLFILVVVSYEIVTAIGHNISVLNLGACIFPGNFVARLVQQDLAP